jgi:immunomodulating metalloprotease
MFQPLFSRLPVRHALALLNLSALLVLSACGGGGEPAPAGSTTSTTTSTTTAPATPSAPPSNTVTPPGSTPTAPAVSPMAAALVSGDAKALDSATALNSTLNLLQTQLTAEAATRNAVFGNGAVTGIDWNPGQESMTLRPLDQSRNHVLLVGNWRYKGTAAPAGRVLAVTGTDPQTGARYAAFGSNPLALRGNAAMDTAMKNTLAWLTGRSDLSGLKVVTSHLPGTATTWFKHEVPTRAWLAAQLPGVTINGVAGDPKVDDTCDGSRLDACLQGAHLLVIGSQEAPNSGTSTYSAQAVMAAVKAAQSRGVAVLFLNHYWQASDLANQIVGHMGLGINTNYWEQEGLMGFNPSSLAANSSLTSVQALLQRLSTGNFSTTWSGCVNNVGKVNCSADTALQTEFEEPATALRTALRALDAKGVALFDQAGYALEKHLVLLGDTYRPGITYPMDKAGDKGTYFRALFSDMTAYINRRYSTTAANQGSFAPAIAADTPTTRRLVSTAAPVIGKLEYMTGLYVMPGRTVTVQRTDGSAVAVTVGINMLRDTTRVYNTNGYDRPSLLASPRVALSNGQTLTITSPFGGPLYLFVDTASAASSVTVQVDGVTTHPMLRNMRDAAEVAAFKAELASTPTNWVGISTEFLTVHSNVKHMRSTLANHAGDMNLLADRIWTYMVKDTYELAGFNSASGVFNLPATVSAFCSAAGWDCSGTQHRREVMQHVIADTVAACGAGCSGNPYDQNWALEPMGWGETHEIGHNLQRGRLNIYGGQSGEVSNNIFPMHKQMAFNRSTNPAQPMQARSASTVDVFNILKASLQPGASATHVKDAIWTDTSYAANNSQRLNFYRQLVEYARHYNPTFSDGWELYTLMYLLERNFAASKDTWASTSSALGFGTYASYPSAMDGNDFMLIAASRIIGRDMRPVWDLWNVSYSAAAASQVTAYGYPAAQALLFPMAHLNAFGSGVGAPVLMTPTATYPAGF